MDAPGPAAGGQLGHGQDVVLVAVHATRREQTQQVDRLARGDRGIDRRGQGGDGGKRALLDGLGDAGEVLVDDAPGPQVHVADLGVAHLAVRQAHVAAIGVDQAVGLLLPQAVHHRSAGGEDGVVGGRFVVAVAVEDDQGYRTRGTGFGHGRGPRGRGRARPACVAARVAT